MFPEIPYLNAQKSAISFVTFNFYENCLKPMETAVLSQNLAKNVHEIVLDTFEIEVKIGLI